MKKRYLLILLVFCSLTTFAQTWTPLTGPFGGAVYDIEKAASGKLYAATQFGGYTSNDAGATWSRISGITNFDVKDFEINPTTGRVYAICGSTTNHYFYSDNGTDWSSSTISNNGITLNFASRIEIHPGNSQILFILGQNYLWRSADSGATWSVIDRDNVTAGVQGFPSYLTDISISSSGAVLVSCQNNSLHRSLFGGANWLSSAAIIIDGSTTKDIRSLATLNDKFYAITTNSELYRSDDGSSNTWTSIITGSFTDSGLLYTGRISFNSTGTLYLAIDDRLWTCADPAVASPAWTRKGAVGGFGLTRMLVGNGTDLFVTSTTHGVLKSSNNGDTWSLSVNGITSIDPTDVLVTSDDRIIITDEILGFYLSTDGGQTWQRNAAPANNSQEYFRKIVDQGGDGILMLSGYNTRRYTGSNVLSTVGNTPTWLPYFAYSKTATGTVIIGSNGSQNYKSVDNGASWTLETYSGFPGGTLEAELETLTNYKNNEGYLFLRVSSGGYKIYRVKNTTTTAELLTLPVAYQEIVDMQVLHVLNGDVLYVLSRNGTTYDISYSYDHGTTWKTISPSALVNSNARKIELITDETIPYKNENVMNVYADGGKIFLSNDNGENWSLETYTAPRSLFNRMAFTTGKYAYLVGKGLQLHKSTKPLLIPAKPTELKVTSFTANRATLTWNDRSSLEQVYVIEKSVGNSSNFQVETQALTNSTTTTFTNLTANTTYYFRVFNKSAAGDSPYSNTVSFTTLNNTCAPTIPNNRSWTSTEQQSRGPKFASLSPAIHTNPDLSYTLTFDATGTPLQGETKVYAHLGLILADVERPVQSTGWDVYKGNWAQDDGVGQMTPISGQPNKWQLTLGPTLRNYFGVAGGTPIYWLALVFRSADGLKKATLDGLDQNLYISVQAATINTSAPVLLADQAIGRYTYNSNSFFESCGVLTYEGYAGQGSWNGTNTLQYNFEAPDGVPVVESVSPSVNGVNVTIIGKNFDSVNAVKIGGVNVQSFIIVSSTSITAVVAPGSSGSVTLDYDGGSVNQGDPTTIYSTNWTITATLNSTDPIPAVPPAARAYSRTGNSNLIIWNNSLYAKKYKMERYEKQPCASDLSGTVSYVTTNMNAPDVPSSSPGPVSGSITITTVSPGVYRLSDYSFGMYGLFYGAPPTTNNFRWSHDCSLTPSGGNYGETSWSYTITSITSTQFTFNWITNFNDSGTTTLTRSDGKSWLQIITSFPFQEIGEVNYPATRYIDSDPVLALGSTYSYRVAAINDAGASSYSNIVNAKLSSSIFTPLDTDILNKVTFTGQGVTCVDIDDDGLDDLIMATFINDFSEYLTPLVYKNNGNGSFSQITIPSMSTENVSYYRGIIAADFNNDGKTDIYCSRGDAQVDGSILPDLLLLNNGNFQFTKTKVISRPNTTAQFNSAVALDYNNDKFLDLMVVGGTETNPKNYVLTNTGTGAFTQNTTAGTIVQDAIKSVQATTLDYDKDGDLDLIVSEYNTNGAINRLYKNNGNSTFTRITGQELDATVPGVTNWRSTSVGDIDNNGTLDLFVQSQGKKIIFKNNNGTFNDALSTAFTTTGFYGSTMGDIDNDGDLDILNDNKIYLNNSGIFTETPSSEAFKQSFNIGLALADFNNDGFLDLTGSPQGGLPLTIFQNNGVLNGSNNWLKIKLKGTASNASAIGARVSVYTGSNDVTQIREVSSRTGYGSQNSLTQHFGLGSASTVTTVVVRWPSGLVQTLPNVAANQTITILEDSAGPIVDSFTPTNSSSGVAVNTTLEITFDEKPVGVANKKITITPTLPSGTPITINATSGVVTENKVTLTLANSLNYLTQYSVTIEAGAFTDIYGNPMDAFTTGWSFTSIDNIPPVFSATSFDPLVPKGFASKLFTATVTDNVNVTGVILSYRGAGISGSYTDIAGVLNAGKWEFPIQESFFNTTGFEFYFTAKDVDNNTTREPASGVKQSLYETTPPTLTVPANPTLISKGFSNRPFKVTATDNFGVTSVVMSYRNTKNGTTYTNLTGTLNTTVANQYDFTVPEAAYNGDGLEYYFTASDATGNTTRVPLITATPATFKMLLDNQAPAFSTFAAPASVVKGNTTFTVKVSDNIGVTAVVMKYRGISAKTFTTSPVGTKNTAGDYEFFVGSSFFDNMGMEYYFRAVDDSKNIGVSPDTTAATNKYHKTYLKFDAANPPKFSLIKGSTGASGYQIISVPLELSNKNIADNFDELGTADKTAYRFLRYRSTPTVGWDEYPGGGLSVLNRGEGYFLNSLKAEEITLLDGVAPPIDQNNFFQLALKKGWNQIGNPYTVQIQWSDVLAYNNNPAGVGKLVKYDNGYNTNDAEGVIEPFKGGFVQVDNDITLKIPFKGFTTGGRMAVVDSDLGKPNWELPFTITQSGLSYQVGMIGMNRDAAESKDNFDLPVVPRLNEYIDASFDHPEHFMKKFSQDVVPTLSEYTWEFSVASNLQGEATMSWHNSALGENSKEIYLLDIDRQQLVNMRNVSAYTFDPEQSKKFRIYFGENLDKKIRPSRVTLSKAYPNPTSGITAIAFSLPEQKASMDVMLEVYDLMGKKLTTLVNGKLSAGFYTAEWDAAHAGAPEGMYVCRLTVSGEEGHEMLSEKIVVKK